VDFTLCDHVSKDLIPFYAVLYHVSIISGEEAGVKLFQEKLITGSAGVYDLVSVPLLHDAHNGDAIIDATVEVDSARPNLLLLDDTHRAELRVRTTSANDEVSGHAVWTSLERKRAQGWHKTIQGAMISSER